MPLMFTGNSDMDGDAMTHLLEAEDQQGRRVVVRASVEVVDDIGLDEVKEKASEKFDAKDFDSGGRVIITTGDFE